MARFFGNASSPTRSSSSTRPSRLEPLKTPSTPSRWRSTKLTERSSWRLRHSSTAPSSIRQTLLRRHWSGRSSVASHFWRTSSRLTRRCCSAGLFPMKKRASLTCWPLVSSATSFRCLASRGQSTSASTTTETQGLGLVGRCATRAKATSLLARRLVANTSTSWSGSWRTNCANSCAPWTAWTFSAVCYWTTR